MKLKIAAVGLATVLSIGLVGCSGSSSDSSGNEAVTVKVGVVGDNNEQWDTVAENLKNDENITIDLVKFSDYTMPNQALADSEIDLNAFQTQVYLDNYNTEHSTDLTTIGYTLMAPMGFYSSKISDLNDLADGATVSIPNDVSNGGRALKLLEKAGLITVNPEAGLTPSVSDITSNPRNLNITELDASQTARSLDDVDAAAINSGMAVDAGLNPNSDAIYLEPVTSESRPYYNVIAARADDVDNETYKTVVEYYQTDEVAQVISDMSNGSQIAIWDEAGTDSTASDSASASSDDASQSATATASA